MRETARDQATYSRTLRVRVRPEDEELVKEAARSAGERHGGGDLSGWVRRILIPAAKRELGR